MPMRVQGSPARRSTRRLIAAALALVSAATVAHGQRFRFNSGGVEPEVHNVGYDGRFTFARLRFTTLPGGFYYRGLPAWAHGYGFGIEGDREVAGHNLVQILREISLVGARTDGSEVLAIDDPELAKFPVAYMTEADYWQMTDSDAAGLRAYLMKGGFVIFDDFRDDFRDGFQGWANFEANMRRVLPEARIIDLDPSMPIFHAFYDIDSFSLIPQRYDQGPPVLRGIFEDNDPAKRMLAVINFNTDVSDFWEFSASGFLPIELSNEAYKLGVNYIIYGMTH